jgi:hypothetical protein
VYDMYPWGDSAPTEGAAPAGGRPAETPTGTRTATGAATGTGTGTGTGTAPGTPLSAVQVALDRRDNGGDGAAAPGTPPSAPARQ